MASWLRGGHRMLTAADPSFPFKPPPKGETVDQIIIAQQRKDSGKWVNPCSLMYNTCTQPCTVISVILGEWQCLCFWNKNFLYSHYTSRLPFQWVQYQFYTCICKVLMACIIWYKSDPNFFKTNEINVPQSLFVVETKFNIYNIKYNVALVCSCLIVLMIFILCGTGLTRPGRVAFALASCYPCVLSLPVVCMLSDLLRVY